MRLLGFLAIAACLGQAQSRAPRPQFESFEVATVKPANPDERGRYIRMQTGNQFQAHNHSLQTLIAAAYNLNPRAISGGPPWAETEHYEIVAKTPGEIRPNLEEQMVMLRKLLADRFHLAFRRETKELNVYVLSVAKGGPKLKATTFNSTAPEGPRPLVCVLSPQGVRMPGQSAGTSEIASVLQRAVFDRPVLDKTGLTGLYDFDLEWLPDETQFAGLMTWDTRDNPRQDLFAAIQQQLGLRLQAAKGPVDTIVITHAERPSSN